MFEQDFEEMLRKHQASLDDRKKFTALVKDLFPDQAKNVNLLLMAYNMGIAQDIEMASHINNTFAFRYVKQLMDDFGMSRVNADWIVSVWCSCYGANVLGKACDISVQKQGSGPAIQGEQPSSGKAYGDLFTYEKSRRGKGLAVTGFRGKKNQTIIFQNRSGNTPVIEIADNSFSNSPIEEAILTEGIACIGRNSFSGCDKLHQVVLPVSIEEIEDGAFENCGSLKSISLPMALKTIGDGALKGTGLRTVEIPKSVFWLGDGLMAECKSLDHVAIPENIGRIPDRMFEGCTSLKKVELHENLGAIGDGAFFGCSSLDFLIIPDSVKLIGQDAFTGTDKQFIIQCSFGSYAEEYARKNRIKYQLV
ncbi:MAG: leucine-rich repeat protein [Eubacteriales bacterium]|nr:leucine-rich repeat protein [Eubacteriales bacterium]